MLVFICVCNALLLKQREKELDVNFALKFENFKEMFPFLPRAEKTSPGQ